MKKNLSQAMIIMLLIFIHTPIYANWGWECTDEPEPYYHQAWGKWYVYNDTKVFMVQIEDQTYKYVFDGSGNFISGWKTYMPMRLP